MTSVTPERAMCCCCFPRVKGVEKDFSIDFSTVFFSLAASCSATSFQLAIEQHLGYVVVSHTDQVTRPSELCLFDVELDSTGSPLV